MVVEAPEFMTVEYLKRRIARAKLLQGQVRMAGREGLRAVAERWVAEESTAVFLAAGGWKGWGAGKAPKPHPTPPPHLSALQFLHTTRFLLRKKRGLAPGEAGSSGGGGGWGMEDLPSATPAGDEVFLSDLGYSAPGPYQIFIASAPQAGCCVVAAGSSGFGWLPGPLGRHRGLLACRSTTLLQPCCNPAATSRAHVQTTDREQQERMLASLMVQAKAHQQARAAAAATSLAAQPPEVQDALLTYQALLQAPAGGGAPPSGGGAISPGGLASASDRAVAAAQEHAAAAAAVAVVAAAAATNLSMGASAAGAAGLDFNGLVVGRRSGGGGGSSSRRQTGRWSAEEVEALIEGVHAHGTRWAQVGVPAA